MLMQTMMQMMVHEIMLVQVMMQVTSDVGGRDNE